MNVLLNADNNSDTVGAILLNAPSITTNGGSFTANKITLGNNFALNTGAGAIALNGTINGPYSLNATGASLTTGSTIGDSTALSDITFATDSIALGGAVAATGDIIIKGKTASTSIGLGGGAGALNLDDTELSYLSAATLIIGDSASGTGDVDIDSWDLGGTSQNV